MRLLNVHTLDDAWTRLSEWDLAPSASAQSFGGFSNTATPIPDKGVFNGLIFTGLDDLYLSHGLLRLPCFIRTSAGGWTDQAELPESDEWYSGLVSNFTAYAPSNNNCARQGWFCLDIETWDDSSQAARIASSAKFVEHATKTRAALNAAGYNNMKFTYYNYPMMRNFFQATHLPGDYYTLGGSTYAAWQQQCEDFATMWAAPLDIITPSLYFFYNRQDDGPNVVSLVRHYIEQNIYECRRMVRKYGNNQKIYPFVFYRQNDDAADLDHDVWLEICRMCWQYADGFVLWGPVASTPWSTGKTLPFWTQLEPYFLTGRRPSKP